MGIGERLKAERLRLGYSQVAFGALAGVSKGTQVNWERDDSSPTANALLAFADAGADPLYILTGRKQSDATSIDHHLEIDEELKELDRQAAFPDLEARRLNVSETDLLNRARKRLSEIALDYSSTPEARWRADDILRLVFRDEDASNRRMSRFAKVNDERGYAERDLEDVIKGLQLDLNSDTHHHLLTIMIEHQIEAIELVPLLNSIRSHLERRT